MKALFFAGYAALGVAAIFVAGCSSGSSSSADGRLISEAIDASSDAAPDGQMDSEGGADAAADASAIRADRFVTGVVSFDAGACGGYGASGLPDVVEGPPIGGGDSEGSLDVVSLGTHGSIVLSFGQNAIVDGPGTDFIVFENVFLTGGMPDFELGEVSVSDDGTTWKTFPCSATGIRADNDYGMCAGWHPTESNPTNGISPVDPAKAGGDPFDLKDVGLTRARYVRVVDTGVDYTAETCPAGSTEETNGFDLDAVAIVNALYE